MAGLRGREQLKTADLAGGWRQRLALGCAVLHEPPILFLDEPTSGVDPASRRNFWEMIGELSSRGITVFVTTHYMDEAEHCDELALIYGGQVVATGSPVTLKQRYMSRALLELDCSDLMGAYAALKSEPTLSGVALFGSNLHLIARRRGRRARRHHGALCRPAVIAIHAASNVSSRRSKTPSWTWWKGRRHEEGAGGWNQGVSSNPPRPADADDSAVHPRLLPAALRLRVELRHQARAAGRRAKTATIRRRAGASYRRS